MDKKVLFVGVFALCLIAVIIISFFIATRGGFYSKENSSHKNYDAVLKEVTLMDRNNDAAKMKLDTELDSHVGAGYTMVAQFTITPKQDIYSFIKGFELINMSNGKIISRRIDVNYKATQAVSVDDYKEECSTLKYEKNQSFYRHCENVKTGSHLENKEVWLPFNNNLKLNEGITIGLFTEVEVGDHVEWIPTFTINGKDTSVSEWASWTADLNAGLLYYYKLDETTGTTAIESVELINYGTSSRNATTYNMENGDWVAGKLGNALRFGGTNEYAETQLNIESAGNFNRTISFWVNNSLATTGNYWGWVELGVYGQTAKYIGIAQEFDKLTVSTYDKDCFRDTASTLSTAGYSHIVVRYDAPASNMSLWINGTYRSQCSIAHNLGYGNLRIGQSEGHTEYSQSDVDELGIWNRTLTDAEITQIYNEGNGISYSVDIVALNYPKSTDIQTSLSVPFNCTVGISSQNLANVSLLINGIYNETNASEVNNANYLFDKTFSSSGLRNWTCEACGNTSCMSGTTENFYIKLNISGTIKDASSNPIIGATIIALNQSGTLWAGNATSDINGNWTIGPVLSGNYSILGYNITNSSLNGAVKSHVIVP